MEEEEEGAGRQIFVYLDAAGHSQGFTASAQSWQTSSAAWSGGSSNTLQKITKAGTAPQLAGKAQKCRDRSRGFETSGCWRNRIEVK